MLASGAISAGSKVVSVRAERSLENWFLAIWQFFLIVIGATVAFGSGERGDALRRALAGVAVSVGSYLWLKTWVATCVVTRGEKSFTVERRLLGIPFQVREYVAASVSHLRYQTWVVSRSVMGESKTAGEIRFAYDGTAVGFARRASELDAGDVIDALTEAYPSLAPPRSEE